MKDPQLKNISIYAYYCTKIKQYDKAAAVVCILYTEIAKPLTCLNSFQQCNRREKCMKSLKFSILPGVLEL